MVLYTKNNLPDNLNWASTILANKHVFLDEYINYKKVVNEKYPVVAEHLNNMITCPLIKAFSVPIFTKNPVRKKKEDSGYYNGICAPTYQMTPEENSYIKYETKLQQMFDFNYFSDDDLYYLFEKSLDLVKDIPKLWQAMFIEFKPGTDFAPHEHPKFYLSSFNLNKANKYMEIEALGNVVKLCEEEPLLIFDSSYTHTAKECGNENRILMVIGSEF